MCRRLRRIKDQSAIPATGPHRAKKARNPESFVLYRIEQWPPARVRATLLIVNSCCILVTSADLILWSSDLHNFRGTRKNTTSLFPKGIQSSLQVLTLQGGYKDGLRVKEEGGGNYLFASFWYFSFLLI